MGIGGKKLFFSLHMDCSSERLSNCLIQHQRVTDTQSLKEKERIPPGQKQKIMLFLRVYQEIDEEEFQAGTGDG